MMQVEIGKKLKNNFNHQKPPKEKLKNFQRFYKIS